jgi:hypothetical protein
MKLTTRLVVAAALVATAACGPSAAKISKAKGSAYQADFTVVWNATLEAVHASYNRKHKVESADEGVIVTDWYKVERTADSQSTNPNDRVGTTNTGGLFFQLSVRIIGKQPPFEIVVDGQAAQYRPDLSMLQPWKHGQEGEPEWVQGRIDAMYVAIYNRLNKYAVPLDQVRQAEPAKTAPGNATESEVGEPQPMAPTPDGGAAAPESAPTP